MGLCGSEFGSVRGTPEKALQNNRQRNKCSHSLVPCSHSTIKFHWLGWSTFPFFWSQGISPPCCDSSHNTESGLAAASELQNSGMHPIRSHRLVNIQVPQGIWNLMFFYGGKDFAPLVPTSLSVPRRCFDKNCGKRSWFFSSFIHCYQFSSLTCWGKCFLWPFPGL